jgi:signal transduction histidine kinase
MILDNYRGQIQDPDFQEMITDIHKSSTSLIDMVNEFLNMSRLELGRIEFKKERFDLVQLLNDVVKELTPQAVSKNLVLGIDPITPASIQLTSDQVRIKEVFVNLIGNSLKYTETGSISIKANTTNNRVVVEITDTGRGIAQSQQHLLFKKFQQTGDSLYTRDTTKSTGLGLYISKLITQGLGGEIGLSWSEPGKGSCFFVILPIE